MSSVLNECNDGQLANVITRGISLGEFKGYHENAVQDSIKLIRKKSAERKRDELMSRIRQFKALTADDQSQLNRLLAEKMELDRLLMH